LYIKSRNDTLIKVNIPQDCLAFQIGEAAQVASRSLLIATPHLVRGAHVENVSRNTFAVFLQPNVDHYLTADTTFDDFTKEVMKRHY
jgi:isopenicillin N synthase-like dioxygenase